MSKTQIGVPCWYELSTRDVDAAAAFYRPLFDWRIVDAMMPGFDYRIAQDAHGHGVAGLAPQQGPEGTPPAWLFYLEVADCDTSAALITDAGGAIIVPPTDISSTGRFAVAADPQGAVFGILTPAPMDADTLMLRAFDPEVASHGCWHELMTTDPDAAWPFYERVFGWTLGEPMDMGDDGTYQLVQAHGVDIGAMMGLMGAPEPGWLVSFGVSRVDPVVSAITATGGTVQLEPQEIPGGLWASFALDPQGAAFGFIGQQR